MLLRIGGGGNQPRGHSIEDLGTRLWYAPQTGGLKWTRSVRRMYDMDVRIRGFVPQAARADGALNFVGAHEHVMRGGGSDGLKPLHLHHIPMDGDMNINMESHNSTLRGFERPCRGLKTPHTAYMELRQIHCNFARTHSTLEKTPAESAGVGFGRPDKRLTTISCAADHNNACKLGEKPRITDDPLRAGFQAVPLCTGHAVRLVD